MKQKVKFFKILVLLLLFLPGFLSCGGKESQDELKSDKVKKGNSELKDTLRILCWEGYANKEYVDDFKDYIKKKYNKDIDVIVKNASAVEEFFIGIRSKKFDIISPAHNLVKSEKFNFISKKIVLPIDLNNIPNYKKIIKELRKADYCTENGEVFAIPLLYGSYGLAYNTKFFKKAPTSWNVFLEKKYKGKYAVSSDYYEANIYSIALAAGLNKKDIYKYEKINRDDIKLKLKAFAENAKRFWVGVDSPDDLTGLALATAWGFSFPELKKRGEIWKMAQPKEGTTGWVDNWLIGYSLANKPEMKKFAEEWINYTLGNKIQVKYLRNIGSLPVNQKIKGSLTTAEVKKYHVGDVDYFKKNIILWKVLTTRDQNGFKKLWLEAKKNR